jgi:DNA polymerase
MVVATEPGEVEERANGPLRGAPGEMLDRMLENVLKLRRAQCYVTTVLHCRPPKGESPRSVRKRCARAWRTSSARSPSCGRA